MNRHKATKNGFGKSWEMRSGRMEAIEGENEVSKGRKMNKIWKDERKDTYRREREKEWSRKSVVGFEKRVRMKMILESAREREFC
jgi:hypothetical protein